MVIDVPRFSVCRRSRRRLLDLGRCFPTSATPSATFPTRFLLICIVKFPVMLADDVGNLPLRVMLSGDGRDCIR